MSWRDLFRRRPPPPPVPTTRAQKIARSIVSEAQRHAAEEYARLHLPLGAEIHEDIDGRIIAPFRTLLPAALARKGLQLVQIEGGWRVQRAVFPALPALPTLPVECSICHGSVFHCRHGEGTVWEAKEEK